MIRAWGTSASHKGMGITAGHWEVFLGYLHATRDKFKVPQRER